MSIKRTKKNEWKNCIWPFLCSAKKTMVKQDNALVNFCQQRYKLFRAQNFQKGRFDVIFQFGDKKLYAHSFVLWPLSEVFEATLFGPMKEKGVITPERYQFEDFKEFLSYLYIGNCKLDAQNVMTLVDLAEYYHIQPLKDKCDAFITENATQTDNILQLYESLKLYKLKSAMSKVAETIATKTPEILKSKQFSNIKKETILDIVKMDNLSSKEEELFQAILQWAGHKHGENSKEEIRNEIDGILPFIRFPIMSLEFIHDFVVPRGDLFPSSFEELSKILRDATAFAQNGSSGQQCSRYSNKFRGGLSLKFFDHQKNTAFAEIKDRKLIEAIKKVLTTQQNQNQGRGIDLRHFNTVQIAEITQKINAPVANAKYYLILDQSRQLSIHNYGEREQNMYDDIMYYQDRNDNQENWFFQQYCVIAPLTLENGNFNPTYYGTVTVKLAKI